MLLGIIHTYLKMVKNTHGGNKAKSQARKNVTTSRVSEKLRLPDSELEIIALVEKMFGGGIFGVKCVDGVTRSCHLRGAFKGRGKRDNFVKVGGIVLVGLREWENSNSKTGVKSTKMENCDLLEVYNDNDIVKLKNSLPSINWSIIYTTEQTSGSSEMTGDDDILFQFKDAKTEEYERLIEEQMKGTVEIINTTDGEIVNVDDI